MLVSANKNECLARTENCLFADYAVLCVKHFIKPAIQLKFLDSGFSLLLASEVFRLYRARFINGLRKIHIFSRKLRRESVILSSKNKEKALSRNAELFYKFVNNKVKTTNITIILLDILTVSHV